MKKTYELLNLNINRNKNIQEEYLEESEETVEEEVNEETEDVIEEAVEEFYKKDKKYESIDYNFFSRFPIENMEKIKDNPSLFESYRNYNKSFIKAIDSNHCVLVNFDRVGNIFENEIEIKDDKIIVEMNDPQAYNIIISTPKANRYKQLLQSKEFACLYEFCNQVRGNVWLKFRDKNLIKM